jgi:hypothetical protein
MRQRSAGAQMPLFIFDVVMKVLDIAYQQIRSSSVRAPGDRERPFRLMT